ncbi:MAG: ThuA domain-containing protein [Terracidiphilus sp.]
MKSRHIPSLEPLRKCDIGARRVARSTRIEFMITAKGNVRRMLASAKCLGSLIRATMRASISRFLILVLVSFIPLSAAAQLRVLVYTRNYTPDGKGYVHDNIASSVAAIRKMGAEKGFSVDVSEDPGAFSETNLKQYAAIVFSNSNNQAFASDAQRNAFKHYIESGGGFVGLHSASGSERDWPYFWSVLGGKFAAHPKMQVFTVWVADPLFAATKNLPAQFEWTDECYFIDHLNPGIHPVLVTDRSKLNSLELMKIDVASFPNPLPLAWYQQFDGGREFYLALGHNKEDYANPILYGIIENGIVWAMKPAQ